MESRVLSDLEVVYKPLEVATLQSLILQLQALT